MPVDGRPLVPLLGTTPPVIWRQSLPIAHWGSVGQSDDDATQDFVGVRTLRFSYARYQAFGLSELYDMHGDIDQLRNIAGTASASLLTQLDQLTSGLAACAGTTCALRENAAAP